MSMKVKNPSRILRMNIFGILVGTVNAGTVNLASIHKRATVNSEKTGKMEETE